VIPKSKCLGMCGLMIILEVILLTNSGHEKGHECPEVKFSLVGKIFSVRRFIVFVFKKS